MPVPLLKSSRTNLRRPRAASQQWLDQALEKIEGVWSDNGDTLNLPGWRTLKYKEFEHDIIICAELTTGPEQACRRCGKPDAEFRPHGHTEAVGVYDLPIRYKRTRIYCNLQRFRCMACGKTTQQSAPGLDEKHHMTSRLVKYIEKESFNIFKTFSALADEIGVSIQLIRNMFTERAEQLEKIRRIETPELLSMDEVYVRRKARCIFTNPLIKRVIDMLPGNGQEEVSKWLLQIPNRRSIKIVTIDMWASYLGAVRRVLPQAAVVVDRYHVHKLLNCAIKDVLSLVREGMSYSEQREHMRDPRLLFKSRYKLSEKPQIDDMGRRKTSEKLVVDRWLSEVPELATAYRLKEDFSDILQMDDRQKAEEEVDLWLERVREFINTLRTRFQKKAGGLIHVPFSNVVTAIKTWREYILNYVTYKYYFKTKPTNGFAESVNGMIKRAQRLGGDYSFEAIRAKAVHGGVLVKERPHLRLVKQAVRTKPRRTRRDRGLPATVENPNANLVRLERVRESRDETKGLLPDPKSNKSWVKRFKKLPQDAPRGGPAPLYLPIGVTESGLKAPEKQTKPSSRPKQEASNQNRQQLSMF